MAQVFNYAESVVNNQVVGEDGIDYVWGASPSTISSGPQPPGSNIPSAAGSNWHEIYWPWGRCDHPHLPPSSFDRTWVMYLADQVTPCDPFGDGIATLDMTNPAVQSWVANKLIPYLNHGYNGISFDNGITQWYGQAGHFNASNVWVAQYSGDNATFWNAQVAAFQAVMGLVRAATANGWATPNQGFGTSDWIAPAATANMYMDEESLTHDHINGTNYVTTSTDWTARMNGYVTLQQGGVGLVLVNPEPYAITNYITDSNTTARFDLQWALANYLLVKYNRTYFWWGGTQAYGGAPTPQHEYGSASAIGTATNDFYAWSSVYRRDFTNGMSLVNPDATTTFNVTLPRTYHDLYGTAMTTASMPAHSGLVLTF